MAKRAVNQASARKLLKKATPISLENMRAVLAGSSGTRGNPGDEMLWEFRPPPGKLNTDAAASWIERLGLTREDVARDDARTTKKGKEAPETLEQSDSD